MKGCELCGCPARMYCESDQASLCWDCDAKVHGANFLVARHSRSLLCHVCRSPTPWRASGAKLGHTVSVCQRCAGGCGGTKYGGAAAESEGGNDDEVSTEDGDLEEDDDDDDLEDEEEEEGEEDDDFGGEDEDGDNQVVPWSSTPPPPEASSSSSEESLHSFSIGNGDVSRSLTMLSKKRVRETSSDLRSQDDFDRLSPQPRCASGTAAAAAARSAGDVADAISEDSLRPFKDRRTEQNPPLRPQAGARTAGVIDSLNRIHNQDINSGSTAASIIAGICNLSKQSGAVDLDCSSSGSRRV